MFRMWHIQRMVLLGTIWVIVVLVVNAIVSPSNPGVSNKAGKVYEKLREDRNENLGQERSLDEAMIYRRDYVKGVRI